jgi:aspartyl/glutamyl-tRNA(Asn/Gln) amidotransferase C subunit
MARKGTKDDAGDRIVLSSGLARLGLDEEDFRLLGGQICRVLDAFRKIAALDTTNMEPAIHSVPLPGPLRDDLPGSSLLRDELMANTKHERDGFFSVRRVIG